MYLRVLAGPVLLHADFMSFGNMFAFYDCFVKGLCLVTFALVLIWLARAVDVAAPFLFERHLRTYPFLNV